jgi:hypothetical protein
MNQATTPPREVLLEGCIINGRYDAHVALHTAEQFSLMAARNAASVWAVARGDQEDASLFQMAAITG